MRKHYTYLATYIAPKTTIPHREVSFHSSCYLFITNTYPIRIHMRHTHTCSIAKNKPVLIPSPQPASCPRGIAPLVSDYDDEEQYYQSDG